MDDRVLMALSLIPGLGPVTWRKLANEFGGTDRILSSSYEQLRQAGAPEKTAEAIRSFSRWDEVDEKLEKLEQIGGRIVAFEDDGYPTPLKQIHDSPMVLFVQGSLLPSDDLAVAMVGTRRASGYGKRIAHKLAFQIAGSGVTIVSGLALGIDTESSKGALDAKGRCIAVLGSGLDVISPSSNRGLAQKIASNGAVITEFPLGEPGYAGNFPRRNRIIAGLAAAVMVIEMPIKSGAQITARYALEQNKDLLVVPGPIDNDGFAGSHQKIREGARPVFDAVDVFESVLPEAARRMGMKEPLLVEVEKGGADCKLPPDQARVFKEIGSEPIHIDTIGRSMGLTIENVLTILLELELRELVIQLPGKMFRRKE